MKEITASIEKFDRKKALEILVKQTRGSREINKIGRNSAMFLQDLSKTANSDVVEKVRRYLQNNENFRPMNYMDVKKYSVAMKRNKWLVGESSICFDSKGNLTNGQHRLLAVILSNVEIENGVMRGVSTKAMMSMDTGRKRTLAQFLKYQGEKNSTSLASALNAHNRFFGPNANPLGTDEYSHGIEFYLELLKKHPNIRNSVDRSRMCEVKKIRQAFLAAIHYEASQYDPETADWWLDSIIRGEQLKSTDAVFHLRAMFINNEKMDRSPGMIAGLLIKSYNMTKSGDVVGRLGFKATGYKAEKFPELDRSPE